LKGGPKKTIEIFKCGFEGDFKINSCKLLPCRSRTIFFLLIRLFNSSGQEVSVPVRRGVARREEGEGGGRREGGGGVRQRGGNEEVTIRTAVHHGGIVDVVDINLINV